MSDFIFNVSKGRTVARASLPLTNDALVAIPIESAGIVDDTTMVGYDTVAQLLAGASNEQATMGRLTLDNVTVTEVGNTIEVSADDLFWEDADGPEIAAIVFVYVPDTTALNDANAIPLAKYDFSITPNGGDITAQVPSGGFLTAP